MFTRSIVSASMIPTAIPNALRWISPKSRTRSSGVRRFESSTPSTRRSGLSTTAAATTGPASGPRPASSTPAMRFRPRRHAAFSKRYGAGAVTSPLARLLARSRRLARCRDLGRPFLFEPRGLSGQLSQVVELGPSHGGSFNDLDLVDSGGVQRKRTFHPYSIGDPADREGCSGPPA